MMGPGRQLNHWTTEYSTILPEPLKSLFLDIRDRSRQARTLQVCQKKTG